MRRREQADVALLARAVCGSLSDSCDVSMMSPRGICYMEVMWAHWGRYVVMHVPNMTAVNMFTRDLVTSMASGDVVFASAVVRR